MAPANVAVRSESWLDLSRAPPSGNLRRGQQQQAEVGRNARELWANYAPEKRHSIGGGGGAGCQVAEAHLWRGQEEEEYKQNSEQHLLIRVRQRSYFNSRCSSSGSLSSRLSQSIELNATISGESHLWPGGGEPLIEPSNGRRLLKRQPLKLATLRDHLKTTTSGCSAVNSSSRPQHRQQSPLARSFSSLSERLGSKFHHFRSSWKQLLHERRLARTPASPVAQEAAVDAIATPHQHHSAAEPEEALLRSGPLSSLCRRELTNHWVRRHQQRPAWPTPPSAPGNGAGQQANQAAPFADSSRSFGSSSTSVCSSSWWSSTASSSSSSPSQRAQQVWGAPEEQRRQDTRSSSTLVSGSSPSASTINSQPLTCRNLKRPAREEAAAAAEATSTQVATTNTHRTTMTQPTSDYWSSSTTTNNTTGEYPRGAGGNGRALSQQPSWRTPALAPDADYYFQVAELERQRCAAAGLLEEHDDDDDDDDEAHNTDYADEDYAEPADESCLLDRSQVELVQMIGEGQKGYVFLGKLQSRDGRLVQDVAIKTLKYETEHLIEKLMREAHLMRQLEHPHIIRFIGVCPDTPALIAMELAELGEIKQYLKLNEHIIPASHLVLFTFQISTALSYLESRQCVHRDVAARNVLVCSHNCVKLADFDLSRDLQPTSGSGAPPANRLLQAPSPTLPAASPTFGHYVATPQGKLPIRWLAPESLTRRRFTSASDVWMFAVCAWELFHYGSQRPWHSLRNNQVLGAIESGQRLTRPPACPERLYQLLLGCWAYAPEHRPRFRDIKLNLWSIYLKERARVQLDLEQRQLRHHQQQLIQSPPPPPAQSSRLALASELFIDEQPDFRQQPRASPVHQLQYSYSSNASGYSSNNPAEPHSNNSSRSSTMGSMMRHKSQVSPRPVPPPPPPAQLDRRFQRIPGHMLERQRSHGSIITNSGATGSHERVSRCTTRDDQMLLQVPKHHHQPRPISEMYTDARRAQEERLVGLVAPVKQHHQPAYGSESRARNVSDRSSSSRPNSTCCPRLPALESPVLRRETTYDGLAHEESARRRAVDHHFKSISLPQHLQANLSAYPQQKLAANIEHFRQPNASLTPNSLEEQRQLALHQRLLGHVSRPEAQSNAHAHQHHRRSVNLAAPQVQQATSGGPETTVEQSLEILESLIAGRNFSKRSAVVKNVANFNQANERGLSRSGRSRN